MRRCGTHETGLHDPHPAHEDVARPRPPTRAAPARGVTRIERRRTGGHPARDRRAWAQRRCPRPGRARPLRWGRRAGPEGVPELSRLDAVGPAKASRLVVALALAGRLASPEERPRLTDSGTIAEVAQARLAGGRVERLLVLVADSGLRLRHLEVVSMGGAGGCVLPVREVLSAVLRHDGVAFALPHNHPGGDPTPTNADRAATAQVADAAGQPVKVAGAPPCCHAACRHPSRPPRSIPQLWGNAVPSAQPPPRRHESAIDLC